MLKPEGAFSLCPVAHSCEVGVDPWPGSHPFGEPKQEFSLQLFNLSLVILFLLFSIVTQMKSDFCFTVHVGSVTEPRLAVAPGDGQSQLPSCLDDTARGRAGKACC